jgi:hypothetical protein
MARLREKLYDSKKQRGHRTWFIIVVFLSALAILDLLAIVVESFTTELPDTVYGMSHRYCIAGSAENLFTDCAVR